MLVSGRGIGEDGVAECFVLIPIPGTVPGFEDSGLRGVGSKIAFLISHLMDSACHKLA